MREAEITCLCTHLRLSDLGRSIARGDVIYVPEGEARLSTELEQARRAGAVRIRFVERFQEQRIPVQAVPKRQPSRSSYLPGDEPPPPAPAPASLPGDAAALLRQAVGEYLGNLKADMLAALKEALPPQSHSPYVPVQVTPLASGSPMPGTVSGVNDSTPVFIPSKIVDNTVKAEVATQKAEGKAEGLDDAAAALKAAKKRNKKE